MSDCELPIADWLGTSSVGRRSLTANSARIGVRSAAPTSQQSAIGNPQWAIFAGLLVCHAVFAQPAPSERALAELTAPAKKLPFKSVIHATTGHRVLDFDTNNPAHTELRVKLLRAAALAGQRARKDGLTAERPNEAGNHLEPFVRAALQEAGLEARIPRTTANRAQAAGYPDIEISGPVPCYLELKSYNAATVNTTQRSFYYSPSETPKVTRDAVHLLLAYELERVERDGQPSFVPRHWRLITLQDLEVDLKFEFNQSNRGLYGNGKATLDEGAVR
jgi:hypothetical protein